VGAGLAEDWEEGVGTMGGSAGAEEKEVEPLAVAPRAAASTEAAIRAVRVVASQEVVQPGAVAMARAARAVAEA